MGIKFTQYDAQSIDIERYPSSLAVSIIKLFVTKVKVLDPKKFLELVKRLEQEKSEREQHFEKDDDVYRETFLNENNILDFLKIAEKEARIKDKNTPKINYLELYQQYEDRQNALFKKDRLSKKKKTRSSFS